MVFKKNINIGDIYAVTGGDYMGEFFVLMEHTDDGYIFLSLPDFNIRPVPRDKYQFAIENTPKFPSIDLAPIHVLIVFYH